MVGKHVIKSYSKQQKVLALSSAEAETYGMVSCSAEVLGIQSCAKDMGLGYDGTIYADASAALGIVQRRGIGKVRHIQTQSLWLQEAHATKRLGFEKIDGSRNPSDLMTKHLTDTLQQRHLEYMNTQAASGRATSAPTINSLENRYYLGTFHEMKRKGILKKHEGIRKSGGSEARSEAGLAVSGARVYNNKVITFATFIPIYNITPYAEVYGQHPREFNFDERGRRVAAGAAQPIPHAREFKLSAYCQIVRSPMSLLATAELDSQEEECKLGLGRSDGTIGARQAQIVGRGLRCTGVYRPDVKRACATVTSGLKYFVARPQPR